MKLKTTMRDGCVHVSGCCVERLVHDAAEGKALMQAMREREDEFSYDGYSHDKMRKRADELMREWGFDSGEVE